jgi:hypothetical protein
MKRRFLWLLAGLAAAGSAWYGWTRRGTPRAARPSRRRPVAAAPAAPPPAGSAQARATPLDPAAGPSSRAVGGGAVTCAAVTRDGRRCTRVPEEGSPYCWQHAGG